MSMDLTSLFTRGELDAVAAAIVELGSTGAICALADRLPLPRPGEAARLTVTVPVEMVRAARLELMDLQQDDQLKAESVRTFLDGFGWLGA